MEIFRFSRQSKRFSLSIKENQVPSSSIVPVFGTSDISLAALLEVFGVLCSWIMGSAGRCIAGVGGAGDTTRVIGRVRGRRPAKCMRMNLTQLLPQMNLI